MASIILNDLAVSEALDRKAMRSIQGGLNWSYDAFAWYPTVGPISMARPQVFLQQNYINYTSIGEMVNETINVQMTNSGAASTQNAVLLSPLSAQVAKPV